MLTGPARGQPPADWWAPVEPPGASPAAVGGTGRLRHQELAYGWGPPQAAAAWACPS